MESNGATGKINISLSVAKIIEKNFSNHFNLEKNKDVELKFFKTSIESFFVYEKWVE